MSLDIYFYEQETCPNCGHHVGTNHCVFEKNITHNLSRMAREAGFYTHLWLPELGNTNAMELGIAVREGLEKMKANPDHFKQFSAENGWGTYEQFIPWLEELLIACKEYPTATLRAST